jgi:hypothetical protein
VQSVLILTTDPRVDPDLLRHTVADLAVASPWVEVVIPAVLPATLPIDAVPERLRRRLDGLLAAAGEGLRRAEGHGRVRIQPCRDVGSALAAAGEDAPAGRTIVVGRAGWRLRRRARTVPGCEFVTPPRGRDRQAPGPDARPHPA